MTDCDVLLVSVSRTNLAASIPQRHWAVVGGVGPGACWIDAAQLFHIMTDVGISCEDQGSELSTELKV